MINHVPGTYVNVVFHELAPDDVYTDGQPAQPLLINGWVRTGHPEAQSSQLVAEIAAAASRVTGIPAKRVLVVIQNSPAHFAIEGGRVLPAPGEEEAWLREQKEADEMPTDTSQDPRPRTTLPSSGSPWRPPPTAT